jgi:heptosyltransferase-3
MTGTGENAPVLWIVHLGGLGDWILTWPSIQALRDSLPGIRFIGVGRPDFMQLAARFGLLEDWMDCVSRGWVRFFLGEDFPSGVRPPDWAVIWMQEDSGPVRLLRDNPGIRLGVVDPVPADPKNHISRIYAESVSGQIGIPVPDDPVSRFPQHTPNSRYSLIHPGSGGLRKCLDPGFYIGLSRLLCGHGFDKTAFLLGPAEKDRGLTDVFETEEWISPDSVSGLADWLSNAALYIGNDSGVSHLAAFMGIPCLVLYTVTDPAVWGARGRRVVCIRAGRPEEAERGIAEALNAGFAIEAPRGKPRGIFYL